MTNHELPESWVDPTTGNLTRYGSLASTVDDHTDELAELRQRVRTLEVVAGALLAERETNQ